MDAMKEAKEELESLLQEVMVKKDELLAEID
jgi:hypothetical protein